MTAIRRAAPIAMLVLLTAGCATYEARNRILLCVGFCALQGVQVVRGGSTEFAAADSAAPVQCQAPAAP